MQHVADNRRTKHQWATLIPLSGSLLSAKRQLAVSSLEPQTMLNSYCMAVSGIQKERWRGFAELYVGEITAQRRKSYVARDVVDIVIAKHKQA